jgi:IS605 OrfB family transposase
MKEGKTLSKATKIEVVKCEEFESLQDMNSFLKKCNDMANAFTNYCIVENHIRKTGRDYQDLDTNAFGRELYRYGVENYSPHIDGSIISQCMRYAGKEFKMSVRKNGSLPTVKETTSCLLLHNQNYTIEKIEGNRVFITVKIGTKNSDMMKINIVCKVDGYNKAIIERIVSGEYKQGQAKIDISSKKKKVSSKDKSEKVNVAIVNLILTYSFEPEDLKLNPEKIAGIDLGMKNAVVIGFNDGFERFFYPSSHIKEYRDRIEQRRRDLRRNNNEKLHNREGHGMRHKIKPADALSNKIKNFVQTENHRIARASVEYVVENEASAIVLEDLRNFNNAKSKCLKDWTYRDLQEKIASKAMEKGLDVYFAKPYNTSKNCSFCGHFNEFFTFGYRVKNKMPFLVCEECKKKINADYNACRNLALMPKDELLSYEQWSKGLYLKKKKDFVTIKASKSLSKDNAQVKARVEAEVC